MKIENAKNNKLDEKLELVGYAITSLSELVNEIFNSYSNFNNVNKEFPRILPKEFVQNTYSNLTIDFLGKNNFLIEKDDSFVITEKTQNIFDIIQKSDIKL